MQKRAAKEKKILMKKLMKEHNIELNGHQGCVWSPDALHGLSYSVQGFLDYTPSQKLHISSACIQQVKYFWHMSDFPNPALRTQEIHPGYPRHQSWCNWIMHHSTFVQAESLLPSRNPRNDWKKSFRCLSSCSCQLSIHARALYKEFTYT